MGTSLSFKKITLVYIENGLERGKRSRELVSIEQGEWIIKNSVSAKSKKHDGIYNIIFFVYIKHTTYKQMYSSGIHVYIEVAAYVGEKEVSGDWSL